MNDAPICGGRGCRIEIRPQHALPSGWVCDPMVIHYSEPTWYIYVNPALTDEHGMIDPAELQRLSQMADEMHGSGA